MWLLSPSGWPVHADTDDEQEELLGRGYDEIDESQVPAAIEAFRAAEAQPPSTQLPGYALAADVATALAQKADASALAAKLNSSTFSALTTGSGRLSEDSLRAASVAVAAKARPLFADLQEPWTMWHRGGYYIAPEGTIEGVDQAIGLGAQFVDGGDWFGTTDGTLVCMHDATVDRTTTATGNTADLTASQRNALVIDAGTWFGGGWGNLKVPTIEQMLRRTHQAVIGVETKNDAAVPLLVAAIQAEGCAGSVQASSFILAHLEPFAAIGCPVSLTANTLPPQASRDALVALRNTYGVPVSVSIQKDNVAAAMATLTAAGLPVSAWTLTRHYHVDALSSLGLIGYVADDSLYVQAKVDDVHGRGLLGRTRERGNLRLRRDPFSLGTYTHGLRAADEAGMDLQADRRGSFSGGRFVQPYPHRWTLHGWAWPLPAQFTIDVQIQYDAVGTTNTQWAGLFFGTTDVTYTSSAVSSENGVQAWLRVTGSLEAVVKTNGAAGSIPTAATGAIVNGDVVKLRIKKTATQIIVTRLDAAGASLGSVTVNEARTLPYLFFGNKAGDNTADTGLRTSVLSVERVA